MSAISFERIERDKLIDIIIQDNEKGINRDYKTSIDMLKYDFYFRDLLENIYYQHICERYNLYKRRISFENNSKQENSDKTGYLYTIGNKRKGYGYKKRPTTANNINNIGYAVNDNDRLQIDICLMHINLLKDYHNLKYPYEKYREQIIENNRIQREEKELELKREREEREERIEKMRIQEQREKERIEKMRIQEQREKEEKEERDKIEFMKRIENERIKKEEKKIKRQQQIENGVIFDDCNVCYKNREIFKSNCGCSMKYCMKCVNKLNFVCCVCKREI